MSVLNMLNRCIPNGKSRLIVILLLCIILFQTFIFIFIARNLTHSQARKSNDEDMIPARRYVMLNDAKNMMHKNDNDIFDFENQSMNDEIVDLKKQLGETKSKTENNDETLKQIINILKKLKSEKAKRYNNGDDGQEEYNDQQYIAPKANEQERYRDVMVKRIVHSWETQDLFMASHFSTKIWDTATINDEVISPHNYTYLINEPKTCKGDIFLLVYVYTSPSNSYRRKVIRDTWGNVSQYTSLGVNIKVVFLLGKMHHKYLQQRISYESENYRDIIQEDFLDTYENLSHKGIMGLKWVTRFCRNAKFILKIDDDVLVNMFKVITEMKNMDSSGEYLEKIILGNIWQNGIMPVIRDKDTALYVSPDIYPEENFGEYCSGAAYMFTQSAVRAVYKISLFVPFIHIEDYYITGRLATLAGVTRKTFKSTKHAYLLYDEYFQYIYQSNVSDSLIFGLTSNVVYIPPVWREILKKHSEGLY